MSTISPELVLVDPVLAGIERARLVRRARLEEGMHPARPPAVASDRAEPRPSRGPGRWWPRAVGVSFGLALFAGGLWAAAALTGRPANLVSTPATAPVPVTPKAAVAHDVLALLARAPARE